MPKPETESKPPLVAFEDVAFDVYSWCPEKDPTTAKATQVHLHVKVGAGVFVIRFKGPQSLDALIAALADHRQHVFGAE